MEFGLKDQKVWLTGVYFVRGNVIDINAIRSAYKRARFVLTVNSYT